MIAIDSNLLKQLTDHLAEDLPDADHGDPHREAHARKAKFLLDAIARAPNVVEVERS